MTIFNLYYSKWFLRLIHYGHTISAINLNLKLPMFQFYTYLTMVNLGNIIV